MPSLLLIYSATVSDPVLCHLGAINSPTITPARAIVHCIVMETHPYAYATDPHTTKVPAEKKPMNNDNPLICQGTAPPAAKKEVMFFPFFEKAIPEPRTPAVRRIIIKISKMLIVSCS